MTRSLVLALGALALTGCNSLAPNAAPPMLTLERLPTHCEGGVTLDDLAPPVPVQYGDATRIVECDVHLVRMTAEVATEALGIQFPGVDSQVVDAADARRVLVGMNDDRRLDALHEVSLSLAPSQHGHVTVSNEVSYVTGFDLQAVPGATIVDPVVETREFGLRVEVMAEFDDDAGPWKLAVAIEDVEPYRPTPIVELAAPATGTPITIQTPIFNRVRVESEGTVDHGQALVIAGPDAANPGDILLAVILPRPMDAIYGSSQDAIESDSQR